MIKIEDFDFFLINIKSHKNILVCNILFKSLTDSKPYYVLDSIKWMGLLEFMIEHDIWYYLEVKNIIPFTTELDML